MAYVCLLWSVVVGGCEECCLVVLGCGAWGGWSPLRRSGCRAQDGPVERMASQRDPHTDSITDTKDTVLTQALVQNVKVNNGTRRDCLMCWEEKTRENLVAYLAGGAEEAPGRSNIDRVSVQRDGSVK